MKVVIVLPVNTDKPIGGFKVVYEYANELRRRGYQLIIVHRRNTAPPPAGRLDWARKLVRVTGKSNNKPVTVEWFTFEPGIELRLVDEVTDDTLPLCDLILVTAWQTAEWVARIGRVTRTLYLVQDYEYYMTADSSTKPRIVETFRAGFELLAISPSVKEMLQSEGIAEYTYLPNAIDHTSFYVESPIEDAARKGVGFAFRAEVFKRADLAVAVVEDVRQRCSFDLQCWSFGRKRPRALPTWIKHYEVPTNPMLRMLYNRTSVFLSTSDFEGWGLPGLEAMACGAALVSTNNGGVRAYAENGINALLVEPGNRIALGDAVFRLLAEPRTRYQLASAGRASCEEFTWKNAGERLDRVIKAPKSLQANVS
jgi:glycosyltransferase involved in cell wall biosynthesis